MNKVITAADYARAIIGGTYFNDITNTNPKFPHYNSIQVSDDEFRIEIALAGYSKDDITVETNDQRLTVSSKLPPVEQEISYIHKGIKRQDFSVEYKLGAYVEVSKVEFINGILSIDLIRNLPDNLKPRKIDIL